MWYARRHNGFTLIEVMIAMAVFGLFALGIYSGITAVFKVVYASRLSILETALIDEQFETARNLPYELVGTTTGVPGGVLPKVKTIAQNSIIFTVTTTVTNVDDQFDGLAGGTPNDTVPADYKLIEMSIQCATCGQKMPLTLSTRLAPKQREGATTNGSLFIHVFFADGNDVAGANVHIASYAHSPGIYIDDVTDSGGMLQILDTPTGTLSYNLTVTKPNFSTDYTVSPTSTGDSDPVKLPASVTEQTATEINFAIDALSNLAIHTIQPTCATLGNQNVTITGDKLIATDPDIPKFTKTVATNASGNYVFSGLEWDTYTITENTSYDLGGSTPMLPLALAPGATQDVSLVLVPHASNSLLVNVRDAGTGLPLSDATVAVTGSSYNESVVTGLGYALQTDWSGGLGQTSFNDPSQYFSDSGANTINTKSPKGDVILKKSGQNYAASGWLESSTIDLGSAVNFHSVLFDPQTQATSTGANPVQVQIATSSSSVPTSWVFTGPDGTAQTYYTPTSTLIHASNNGSRYLRYRLFLSTANTSVTPDFAEIAFTYIASCTPPGQAFFSGLNADTYTVAVTRSGYAPATGSVDVSGSTVTDINLSPN